MSIANNTVHDRGLWFLKAILDMLCRVCMCCSGKVFGSKAMLCTIVVHFLQSAVD